MDSAAASVVSRCAALRWSGGGKESAARIVSDLRNAAGQDVGERREVSHGRCLVAVERVLYGRAPPASLQIDKIGNIARHDLEAG